MTQAPSSPPPAPPSRPTAAPAPPARRAARRFSRTQIAYPSAGLDRRFYAFAVDRLVVWGLYAGAAYLAHRLFFSEGETGAGVGLLAGAVVVLGLASSALLGLAGLSPGKAVTGLRVVRAEDGAPLGILAAVARTLLVGAASLPTLMLGVATLAWTAAADPSGSRRGWHDRRTGSVVVDVRPVPVTEDIEEERPRQIVNLTAMRLMPTPPPATTPPPTPARAARPTPATPPRSTPPRSTPPTSTPPTAPPGTPPAGSPTGPTTLPPGTLPPGTLPPGTLPPGTPPPAARRAPGLPGPGPSTPPPSSSARSAPPTAPPPSAPPGAAASSAPSASPGAASSGRWRVTFDTGETFLVEGLALVGRRPEARAGEQVAHLVSLRSTDMSLSKTHAQFQVVPDGALVVMDRGSTNGSVLVRRGVAKPLSAGRPATLLPGDKVRFGDREMSVEQP